MSKRNEQTAKVAEVFNLRFLYRAAIHIKSNVPARYDSLLYLIWEN